MKYKKPRRTRFPIGGVELTVVDKAGRSEARFPVYGVDWPVTNNYPAGLNGKRALARRARQIANGHLRAENGRTA